MTTQLIAEFSADDFVPGIATKAEYGVQDRPSENTPIRLLLVGYATDDGSITPDVDIVGPILSESEGRSVAGAGGELCRGYFATRNMTKDIEVYLAAVAPPGGAVQATATLTIGGSWSTAGEIGVIVGGDRFFVTVGATNTPTQVATALAARVGLLPDLCVTATSDGAAATLEHKTPGPRGNDTILYVDLSDAPSGLTIELEPPEAELVALAVELREEFTDHIALTAGSVHGAADSGPYTIGSAPTNRAQAITVLGQLLTAAQAHVIKTAGSVHGAADTTAQTALAALTAPTTGQEAVTFANAFKTAFFGASGHTTRTASSIHGAADNTNTITTDDAITGLVTGDEVTGDGVRFSGGTGTEDVTNIITRIKQHSLWFKRLVVAQNDSTNVGRWETFADDRLAPLVQKSVALMAGHTGTQSAGQAISKTALNHVGFEVLWAYDAESSGFEIACTHMAERVLTERNGPGGWNSSYSGTVLPGIKLARDNAKIPTDHATQKSALQNGLSPVIRAESGDAVVVKAITTKCQNADGSANYLSLDVADFVVTEETREMTKLAWLFYRSQNKHVRDDFAAGEKRVASVATPTGFRGYLAGVMNPLVDERVFETPPRIRCAYNRSTRRIQTVISFNRLPLHEQGEAVVQQLGG